MPASVVRSLATVPGAARVDGNVRSFGVFVVGTDGKVVGGQGAPGLGLNYTGAPAGHGLTGLTMVRDHPPHGRGQVALDRRTAHRAGYRIGDRVHLVTTGKQPVLRPTLVGLASLGLGLGVLLALGIRALFARFGLDLSGTGLVFAPRTVVAAYAVGILVTVVAAYLPARRSARVPPVAALRDEVALPESTLRRRLLVGTLLTGGGVAVGLTGLYGDVASPAWWVGGGVLAVLMGVAAASAVVGRPFMAATGVLYRQVFGTVGLLAGQNAARNPRRTAATASALMIGLALVTTMAIVGASAKRSVDQAIAHNFLGDLVVSNPVGQPFSPSLGDRVARTPGVASVTRVRYAFARADGHQAGLVGVSAGSLRDVVRIQMVAGSARALRDGRLLVSQPHARSAGLHVGDFVRFQVPAGTERYRVVGIYQTNPVLGYAFTTTLGTLAKAGFPAEDNYLLVTDRSGARPAAVQAALERETAAMPTVAVKNQAGYAAAQRAPIDRLLALIYALLGLALVIAVLGIVNTLALSVIERTREVGLLRAIGLSRAQLRRMVPLEAVALAVLGAVLGVGMGVLFGVALMAALRGQGLQVTAVPAGQLLAFVAASAVVGVLAAVLPARRAARLDVLRAIATE